MICWHFMLRRQFVPYLEGELSAPDVKRMEQHLLDCARCRELLVRLRSAHQMALRLRRPVEAKSPQPSFDAVMAAVEAPASRHRFRAAASQDWRERLATPRAVTALAVLVLLQLGLLVVTNRGVLFGKRSSISVQTSALDLNEFRELSIGDLKSNTQPHIATDGYVSDVHTDEDEGTIAFRLAETPGAGGPFVVCEIMSPIQMPAPREGAHVRVYGVARYDAQSDRKWYEVNPVLNIAVLKR